MLKSSSLCLYSSNLGTFWLKIEQFWPFEGISIFSNGGQLGYRTALTDTILKADHLRIVSAKFGWNWLSSFSQKVPKFELYEHNDELFNIYYRIFLWNLNFCRFWPIMQIWKKGGWNLKKNLLLWNYWANLNQTLLKWFLGGPLPNLCPAFQNTDQDGHHSRT